MYMYTHILLGMHIHISLHTPTAWSDGLGVQYRAALEGLLAQSTNNSAICLHRKVTSHDAVLQPIQRAHELDLASALFGCKICIVGVVI